MVVERPPNGCAVDVVVDAQRVLDVDAPDHEHAVLRLDLPGRVARELPSCGVDVARLQRASEGAGQSAGSRGDDVVERGRPLDVAATRDAVVIRDLVVHAEPDRLVGPGELRAAKWALHALDPHPRRVHDVAHVLSLRAAGPPTKAR